ncbi:MAG: DMT family transporter [Deltaproteobacteria bacterium]|nr:MAG: DMT family transporter [Deltaproteobacteria bacterium]
MGEQLRHPPIVARRRGGVSSPARRGPDGARLRAARRVHGARSGPPCPTACHPRRAASRRHVRGRAARHRLSAADGGAAADHGVAERLSHRHARRHGAAETALGDALTLACAVVFAGQIVALGRAAPKHPVLPLVLVQLATTGALAALAGPFVEAQHFSAAPRLWAALLYLAVFATLLAFGIQTWAQKVLPPVRVALISALESVFAALWAAVLIGERLTLHELAGGALIVLGVAVGEAGAMLRARARTRLERIS